MDEKEEKPDDGGTKFYGTMIFIGLLGLFAVGVLAFPLLHHDEIVPHTPDVPDEHKIECQQCLKEFIPNITKEDAFGYYWWLLWHEPSEEERYDAEYIAGKWTVLRQCNCACLHHNCEVKS